MDGFFRVSLVPLRNVIPMFGRCRIRTDGLKTNPVSRPVSTWLSLETTLELRGYGVHLEESEKGDNLSGASCTQKKKEHTMCRDHLPMSWRSSCFQRARLGSDRVIFTVTLMFKGSWRPGTQLLFPGKNAIISKSRYPMAQEKRVPATGHGVTDPMLERYFAMRAAMGGHLQQAWSDGCPPLSVGFPASMLNQKEIQR